MKLRTIKMFAIIFAISLSLCSCTAIFKQQETNPSEQSTTMTTENATAYTEPVSDEISTETTTEYQATISIEFLLNNNYIQRMFCYSNGILSIEYISADNTDFILASCEMNEEDSDAFFDLDVFDENYKQICIDFLSPFSEGFTFKSLNEYIPSQESLNEYIGLSFEDFESSGFEQTSIGMDENDELYLEYSDGQYFFAVFPNEKAETLSELFDSGLENITIAKIYFLDFSDINEFIETSDDSI